jgi:hypothetical protein
MWLEEKVCRTFMFEYQFASFFIKALSWIALGGLVTFLGRRHKYTPVYSWGILFIN